jgi:hypothetical protein
MNALLTLSTVALLSFGLFFSAVQTSRHWRWAFPFLLICYGSCIGVVVAAWSHF